MKNNQTPEIRFPGFIEYWKQQKLGDLADFSKGNGYSKSDLTDEGEPIILYGRLYTKYETVIESVDTFTIEKEKSVVSKGNEVIVPSSGETSEDISRASVVKEPGIILGGDLNIIRPTNDIDSVFLALSISNGKQRKELIKRAQGKSVVHLHNSDLKEVNLSFSKKEEQTKIADFFKQLDATIVFQEQELTTLKQTKQGFLQKMFPKEGESVPEVRFLEFTGDWEQHALKDLGEIKTGSTPSTADVDNYSEDGMIWVTPTDIDNRVTTVTAKKLSEKGQLKARIVKPGTILVTSIASIGKNTMVKEYASFNQQINSLTPSEENDSYFLLTQSDFWSRKMKNTAASGTMQIINKNDFSNISVLVPKIEEQTKIGNFFKQLDDTIALHQRELDALKETKKAFLQKMFV
ncbi:restriction endonuclease subunit S [Peribacillus frigoritolerans]|uniref:restriction endonuclease subunit S n=1 Tax=Peribacillus frigoritolerans TaxID=450367 RepID=UPI0021A766E8|nr:restriction endonuclease subunit S [Peribacillus frigoritolerans]MCT1390149.1 restriction endonuclease subunit S [Peribacillus frigoritolerans]MEE3955738.1 restriction endonuclease subunit S [Peribacillus frigoritolerans]